MIYLYEFFSARLVDFSSVIAAFTFVILAIFVTITASAGKKLFELIEFDFSRAILVNLGNQFFNINCHLKLLLDGLD